jgi:hypothetical protein
MYYNDYIKLGFERTDLNDSVEFKQTGFYGYFLNKDINEIFSIQVSSGELDEPKLYIKKRNTETCHIIAIKPEIVRDLFDTISNYENFA